MPTETKSNTERCERCEDGAVLTLTDHEYCEEYLCIPCARAVVQDRAFSRAWNSGLNFDEACTVGDAALNEWEAVRYFAAPDDWPLRCSRAWWSVYDLTTGAKYSRPGKGCGAWRFGSATLAEKTAARGQAGVGMTAVALVRALPTALLRHGVRVGGQRRGVRTVRGGDYVRGAAEALTPASSPRLNAVGR